MYVSFLYYKRIQTMVNLLNISFGYLLMLLFIAFILLFILKNVLKPYLILKKMKKALQGKHSFYAYPSLPLGMAILKLLLKDFKQYGDTFYSRKKTFSKCELSVGVYGDNIAIGLNTKQFAQEYAERQKEGCYKKTGRIHFESWKQFLGNGLLMSQNQEWKYKRKLMSSLFNYEFIKSKFAMVVSIVKEQCDEAKNSSNEVDGKKLLNINRVFQRMFGTVVLRCFFGNIKLRPIKGMDPFDFLSQLCEKIVERSFRLSSFMFGGFLIKYGIRKIDRQVREEINLFRNYTKDTIKQIIEYVKENASEGESEGLVAKLMREKRLVAQCSFEEKIKNGLYTHEDLTSQLCTFFFAGTDTTSSTMSSLIFKLLQHKEVEQKLRVQIKQVLNDDIGNITLENLKKMDYLRYVQSEIFRLLPAAPVTLLRESLCDHKLGDLHIQKGMNVFVDFISHQHDEKIFENPLQFKPERWVKLEKSPSISQDFYPFSVGLRTCIGQQLALTESKVALIVFLLTFKNGSEVEPPRFKMNMTYGPEKSFMKFKTI